MQAASHETEKNDRFAGMSDEEIVRIAQSEKDGQATDYIVHKYRNFVKSKARAYFLVGADRDDIIQEGMIGLYKATRDFAVINCRPFGPLPNCALPGRSLRPLRRRRGRNTYLSILTYPSISPSMMKIPTGPFRISCRAFASATRKSSSSGGKNSMTSS